jgi:hypothetical protein
LLVALEDGRRRLAEETDPTLPFVLVLLTPLGVLSSSVNPDVVGPPRAEALRGPMLASRSLPAGTFLLGSPAVPRTLCANLFPVGLPNRAGPFGPGAAIDGRGVAARGSLRTGESGRGNEVRGGLLPVGLAARPGPTDWENFDSPGVGGVKLVEFWLATFSPFGAIVVGVSGKELADVGGEFRLYVLFKGTKMPEPGVDVLK